MTLGFRGPGATQEHGAPGPPAGAARSGARVLHILEPGAGGEEAMIACRTAMRLVERTEGRGGLAHSLWIVGGSRAEITAADSGLPTDDRLAPPLGAASLAVRAARGLARRDRRAGADPRAVVCWSLGALAIARAVYPRTPRIAWVNAPPDCRSTHWTRRFVDRSALAGPRGRLGTTLLTANPDVHAAWGIRGDVDIRGCAAPAAATAMSALARTDRRAELLRRAGVLAQTSGGARPPVLIALLNDPLNQSHPGSRDSDARTFAFVLGLLYTTGQRVIGVLPSGHGGGRRRAARFVRAHGRQWGLIELDSPMEPALAACDLAMWNGRGGLSLAAGAAAAGVPVVAADSFAAHAVLGSAADSCIADRVGAAGLAAKLLPLVEHESRRAEVGARLRAAAEPADPARPDSFEHVITALWRELIREARPRAAGSAAAAGGSAGGSSAAGFPAITINTGAAG